MERKWGTELVVIQPTSFCNLNCKYCYVPDRNVKSRISEEILRASFKKLLESDMLSDNLLLLWHAGEPLSVGIEFYEQAQKLIKQYNIKGRKVTSSVQTNGTLINDAWCELFKKYSFKVGISLDGPDFLHNANRVGWDGKGSFDRAVRGAEYLRKHGLDLAAICVLTPNSLNYPEEILNFFIDKGFMRLALLIEYVMGENGTSKSQSAESDFYELQIKYEQFIQRLYKAWLPVKDKIYVRELAEMCSNIHQVIKDDHYIPVAQEVKELNIITIQANGNISTYDPELAGGYNEDRNKFVIGNILEINAIEDILQNDNFLKIKRAVNIGIDNCRNQCEYFRLCGGRSPAHKYYENGTFESTETKYCKLQTQTLAKNMLIEMKNLSFECA